MSPEELTALNRAIVRLFDRWLVSDAIGPRVLDIEPERYLLWKRGELTEIDDDLKLRLVLLLGIHVQLSAVFGKGARGYAWMNKPNDLFSQSPLGLLSSGNLDALLRLQAYLAAEVQAQ
ncbi:hypothetical protein J2X48_001411 [Bosea sp. BE271]|uniref:antitoxin Xre/MbcA/ParS toxin-binding domain-containing protein n=1 Tax=Bosea TaxID=85413 RepID=UPI0028668A07|nr:MULTISPECIES: antitoxin Xre/MbcA/ParS toxin-binding domain-containing protein [Bosea]MDR6827685.1 hypothetical protein [Bosea robiniae]MDR6894621.1 hypothetical protein [Bosea sp. BE109]MDR7137791.1 hypothetical protein [Bosea sp. BE168]MDR7174490.1 hypothetical protein [Bosea sp. BE271]